MDIVEIVLSTCLCICVLSLASVVAIYVFLIIKELTKGVKQFLKNIDILYKLR